MQTMEKFKEGQEQRIREAVQARVDQFAAHHFEFCCLVMGEPDAKEHIIEIGVSILATKWEIGPSGGSFVQAIVDNDLTQSFARADHINVKAIPFYVSLLYNQGYIQ